MVYQHHRRYLWLNKSSPPDRPLSLWDRARVRESRKQPKLNSCLGEKLLCEGSSPTSAMAVRDLGSSDSRFSGCGGAREHGPGACSIR